MKISLWRTLFLNIRACLFHFQQIFLIKLSTNTIQTNATQSSIFSCKINLFDIHQTSFCLASITPPTMFLIVLIILSLLLILFLSITGYLIYRYQQNRRRYLQTLTRTIYNTLQRNPSVIEGLENKSSLI